MIMAVQPIGGVSATTYPAPAGASAPADATRRTEAQSKDSTVVISRVTRTKDDGSTVTTTTYADGHTKIETTPPTELHATEAKGGEAGGRVTAVDILA
jgi:hypothetical protein